MTWRHVLGVFVGVVFGFVLSLVMGLVVGIGMVVYYTSQGATAHQAARQLDFAHLSASIPFLLATLAMGAFALLLSGVLTGWIGGTHPVLTSLATGIISTLLAVPFYFFYPYPLWYELACVVATILPAVMGGYIVRVFANVRSLPPPATS